MSYQQYPPAGSGGGAPVVQQPAAPFAAAPEPGARKPALIGVGALLLAAGVVTGIVLIMASSSNYTEGVKNLARAPIGCTTTLQFDEAGTYYLYIETSGSIGDLRGDCPNADTEYDSTGDDLPDVDIVLVDDRGDDVDLDRDDSKDYDTDGFVGRSEFTVAIEEPGDYELTATSDESEVVVAVGRTPNDDAASLRTMGILALVAGLVIGGLLLLLGLRRSKPAAATPVPPAPGGFPANQFPGGQFPAGQYPPSQYPPSGQIPVTPPTATMPTLPTQPMQPTVPAPPAQPPYQPPAPPAPTQPMPPTPAPPTQPMPPTAPPPGSWPAPPSP